MKDVAALQLHLRKKKDGWAFYHAQVWAVLASGIFQTLAGEEGKKFTVENAAAVEEECSLRPVEGEP